MSSEEEGDQGGDASVHSERFDCVRRAGDEELGERVGALRCRLCERAGDDVDGGDGSRGKSWSTTRTLRRGTSRETAEGWSRMRTAGSRPKAGGRPSARARASIVATMWAGDIVAALSCAMLQTLEDAGESALGRAAGPFNIEYIL